MNNIIKISALANAKINLDLNVLNKRDDGYHNINSIFQSVSLADEITISASRGNSINVITKDAVIEGENLAKKAAELFLNHIKAQAEINISLKKNIPLSAGIGGGSTDAAAVLICLNKLFSNPLSDSQLLDLGLNLGADVPFCILGGTALVEGIGEKLTPLAQIGDYDVILIKHHKKASTGEMYGKIDLQNNKISNSGSNLLKSLKTKEYETTPRISHNSFLSVSDYKTEQEAICNLLISKGAFLTGISGSGPTIFGLFKGVPMALVEDLKSQFNEVYLCKTKPYGIKIIE